MSFELDKIESVNIYSFETVEEMRDFVSKNNVIEYELKSEGESDNSQRKYNTRSRPNSDQCRLGDALSSYLNKLDTDHILLDPAAEDLNMISVRSSKRHTRSQAGRVSLPECGKIYCRLGCICENSESVKKKTSGKHCGRFECMFECNCARKLRSSTRARHESDTKKTSSSSSGSVCSRSSSNSSTSLRKSKRCRNKVNYSSYSKTGSCSDRSADSASKTPAKFRPYTDTVSINHTQQIKLEILIKNFDSVKEKILDFLKKLLTQLELFEWKEICFSYDKVVNVCLKKTPLVARVTKFKNKDGIKKSELDVICSKFPMVCIHLFRFKKNSANKENKAPTKPVSKILPRLLCRKASKGQKSESRKIFTNLESLLEQLPKKYDKISDVLRNYRNYDKIKLFKEEKEFLSKNNSLALYDPFSDQSLIIDCYKKVDCRPLVDTVAETLNDMIGVVCTHKENIETKREKNSVQTEMPKKRPNVIILKRNLHKNSNQLLPQGKTFVKILNTNEGNRVSIINKTVDERPVFKVSFDQSISTLATIKHNLQVNDVENKKRKRKQDLSFLSTKIIQINRVDSPTNKFDNAKPIIVSRTLFSKKFKSNNNQILASTNLVKQEPETMLSESLSNSAKFLTFYNETSANMESFEESSENSLNFEQRASPFSMLKLETLPSSSNSNSNSCRKFSTSSNCSSFKVNKNFEDELMDSDVENEDDSLSKSSDSTKSNELKNVSLNLHSVRERQRRLRLKNLLNKLKFALYDIDENTSSVKINNSNFKHSKQATLAEAVDTIKNLEIQGEKLEQEFENLKTQNLILSKRLENLKALQWSK